MLIMQLSGLCTKWNMIADLVCSGNYINLRLQFSTDTSAAVAHPRHTEPIQDRAQPRTWELLQLYDLMTNDIKHNCWPCLYKKLHKLAFSNFRRSPSLQWHAQDTQNLYKTARSHKPQNCCSCTIWWRTKWHMIADLACSRNYINLRL